MKGKTPLVPVPSLCNSTIMLCPSSLSVFSAPESLSSLASCFLSIRWTPKGRVETFQATLTTRAGANPASPAMLSQTCLAFCSCCVPRESPVATERFFPNLCPHSERDPKPMESCADTPIDLQGPVPSSASEEPSMSPLLCFQEILKPFSAYIKAHHV